MRRFWKVFEGRTKRFYRRIRCGIRKEKNHLFLSEELKKMDGALFTGYGRLGEAGLGTC